jgi:uncharacterized protein
MPQVEAKKPPRICYRAARFTPESVSDGRTLEGYAAVFNERTEIDSWEGSFNEEIAPGAFKRTINARMPVLQFDHGHDLRTGSVPIGSIQEIREDAKGLWVSARLFDNPVVEPIRQAIEGGAIDGMSFRFRVVREDWANTSGERSADPDLRIIREVELFELGPVVFPAYEATSVGVRSMLARLNEDEQDALVRRLVADILAREEHDAPVVEVEDASGTEVREDESPTEELENAAIIDSRAKDPVERHSSSSRESANWHFPPKRTKQTTWSF